MVTYYVYVLASRRHGTLYVGVTNSLERRISEHKAKAAAGFTKRYDVNRLVWWRTFGEVGEAIRFEKQLKRWRRDWKVALIEAENPAWGDLYPGLIGPQLFGADAIAAIDAHAQRHPGRSEAESRGP